MTNLPPAPQGPTNTPAPEVVVPAFIVPAPPYTVLLAMNVCGSTRANQDQKFATEVFMDDFESSKYMSNEDLAWSFKTFSVLTATQGHIRIIPLQKNKIKSFTQWVKEQFILGIDPITLPFPQSDTAELLRRSNNHQLLVSKSDTISKAAKPVRLIKQVRWEYLAPTFMKYVSAIPGRYGVPLKYIIRDNDFTNLTPNKDFLDDYVDKSSLKEESFTIDSAKVHTFIVNLIDQNEESESVIKIH